MNNLTNRIGRMLPNGFVKNVLRKLTFPIIFFSFGTRSVKLGPPENSVVAKISFFPFYRERLGQREIEGYLQQYRPKPGDITINAGGYHGYFAIYLARKVGPTGHVYCFEPDPINASVIKKNIEHNKLKNITLIVKGLSNKNGIAPFEIRGSSSRISSGINTLKIRTCRLDDEMRHHNVKSVNFISMDIEGSELNAIAGARQIVKNSPGVHIAIASYHIVNGEPTYARTENILRQYGLTSFTGFHQHLTTYAYHTKNR